eukprot:TRINITY_DN7347_c0_g1_i1.p1 TRINITY_DN7347_c0_g1~~TRINITY_DN7347_c0_g1_i1.p1  ORF type:complete len:296 (-),score=82.84 TRINITY_DN7347_c0_g1_i1:88-879(-)
MATKLKDYVSHYEILEVNGECTKTEIREAWLRLSMMYHPDLNKDNEEATKKFMEVKESYKVLVNDEKRKAYNDKIGFYHSDPPPEFQREWSYQGEMERSGAAAYNVLWSEEAIRKLMCSDTLRDLNWSKQPPAERFRILLEEQNKQELARNQLAATDTISLKVGADRYSLMIIVVIVLVMVVQIYDRQIPRTSVDDELAAKRDIVTSGGAHIHTRAQVDIQREYRRTVFEDPARPDRYWVTPGHIEGCTVADNSENDPPPHHK